MPVHSCTLWAPACTTRTFQETYAPAIEKKRIRRFQLITLTDRAEQADNCAGIYDRSLLYLISQAFEDDGRVPGECAGTAILGMERFLPSYPDEAGTDSVGEDKLGGEDVANQDDYDQFLEQFADLMKRKRIPWLRSPAPLNSGPGPMARRHGDFDDDEGTVLASLRLILDGRPATLDGRSKNIAPPVRRENGDSRCSRGLSRRRAFGIPGRRGGLLALFGARAAQDALEAVVGLVAGVFEDGPSLRPIGSSTVNGLLNVVGSSTVKR